MEMLYEKFCYDIAVMGKTVLIVDDELGIRELIRSELPDHGYNVLTASGGGEALEILRKEKVDLVVTDMKMPHMDGLDVVIAVKKEHPGVPIVLMTGYAVEGRVQEALGRKATACLRKPFEIEDLASTIHAALPA